MMIAHDQYDGKSNDEAIVLLLKNYLCLVLFINISIDGPKLN
jgi:hypothetical protein